MNSDILNVPFVGRLGWTLVHFVWQGAVLALFFALVRGATRGRAANVRYLAGCLTLLLMVAAPTATLFRLFAATPHPVVRAVVPAIVPGAAAVPAAPVVWHGASEASLFAGLGEALETTLPWLVMVWVAGVVLLTLRLVGGWWQIRRARVEAGESLEELLGARLRVLERRLRLSRPVRLMKSALVEVPTVIGWLRPVILLPAGALTGLTPVQLDLILAHELAHLRRWDHWVNLGQLVIETLLFYHPAVWWVSRCVREEREHCCDDLAVAVCGHPIAYAQALATLEELRQSPADLALAAAGGSLLGRIRRVLGLPEEPGARNRWSVAGSALLVLGLTAMAAGAVLFATGPRLYRAIARIHVEPPQSQTDASGRRPSDQRFDPYFFQTEFERLRSGPVLTACVQRLGLTKRWGVDSGGRALSEAEAVNLLAQRIEIRQVRSTSLIEVRVVSPDAREAAELANTVVEVYRDQKLNELQGPSRRSIDGLRASLVEQTQRVNEISTNLDGLHAQLHVPELAPDLASYRTSLEQQKINPLLQSLIQAQTDADLADARFQELSKLSRLELAQALPMTVPGETQLPALQTELSVVERQIAENQGEFANDHPTMRRLLTVKAVLEKQIEARISGVLSGLEQAKKINRIRKEMLSERLAEARNEVASSVAVAHDYFRLKTDLDNQQRIRDAVLLRIIQEEVDTSIAKPAIVEIVDRAEPPLRPFPRYHPLDRLLLLAGAVTSLLGLALRLGGSRAARPTAPATA